MRQKRYVVVDIETTGNSSKKGDRMIQFAAVVIENDQIVQEFSTYIHPEQEISLFIEELTGISNEMVKDAPTFKEVAESIIQLLDGACFVAHNVNFDLSFLQEELTRCGYELFHGLSLDTVELAKILKPTSDGYKLHQLAIENNIEHLRPHQADSDAYATALLLLFFKKKLFHLPLITLKQLYRLSFSLHSDVSEFIDDCIQIKLSKPEEYYPEITIYRGLAFKKVENESRSYSEKIAFPEDDLEKEKMFRESFLDYEVREGQLKMMNDIYHSFEKKQNAIIEAGTGIGKSLGYLFPAIYFSKKREQPIVISTYTLQLQDQLLQKEIPKLKEVLPFGCEAVLLKGRGNYLSLAKFERALYEKDDHYESALTKMQILVWLTETETGDKDELHLSSGGELIWNRLQSDGLTYPGLKKPWYGMDYFEKAKQRAADADLIITNHAFLMSDLIHEDSMLARYEFMIIDEAHHLERAASRQMGRRLDYISVKTILNRLGTAEQKQLLYRVTKILSEQNLFINKEAEQLEEKLNDFLFEFEQLFYFIANQSRKVANGMYPKQIVYKKTEQQDWLQALLGAERVVDLLQSILHLLSEKLTILKQHEAVLGKSALFYLDDLEVILGNLYEIKETMIEFFIHQKEECIYWIEYLNNSISNGVVLSTQPVLGNKETWKKYFGNQSIIMTSATLSVRKSFQFFKTTLGIGEEDIYTVQLPSPFSYEKQVKVLVPNDLPNIKDLSVTEFSEAIANHVIAVVQAAQGRTLVLFTSHDLLRETFYWIKECGLLEDYMLFAQGISGGSKMKLLRNFQSFEKSVLFGTTSLWEGIDIPGEDLSCLVIVRLPFSPPDEPITEARCQLLEAKGQNAFYSYSLPEALIRFRQGFGRLIRTSTDRGVLVVLDRRVITSKYGIEFQKALPSVDWEEVSIQEMSEEIEKWLERSTKKMK